VAKFTELGVQSVSRVLNFVSPVVASCGKASSLLNNCGNYLKTNLVSVIKNEIYLRPIHIEFFLSYN
jgi:hypothetical protein